MRRKRLAAVIAGALAAALLLSGCVPVARDADAAAAETAADGIIVPTLTVDGVRLHPVAYRYRLPGGTRRSVRDAHSDPLVRAPKTGLLRARLVSGYTANGLYAGTFSALDRKGRPVDGGDQYDCVAGGRCTVSTRAGSVTIELPAGAGTRLVIVRSTFELPDSGALEAVWRFRIGRR
ncbi:hypothetical protein [Leifsonia shinshuensis]